MGCTFIDTILISAGGNCWIFLLQALLIVAVIWVLLHKTYLQHERNELTDDDIDARIEESLVQWEPEDLVLSKVIKERILKPKILKSKAKKYMTVDGKWCLNLATMNFLDLIGNQKIEDQAVEAIRNYGVGSCGPRGFYGTVEVHLELEERLAKFMGTEDAIVYSFGFSCIASAIPAYAKRHDIIFADERVNFAIQKGLYASRSTVIYFRHNDHEHLEILLLTQALEDQKNPEKAAKTRKFVIIEGIYMNTGELVNLPYYMKLKEHFKFRLFIDESISFGTVGYGRGVTRHYNIPIEDVDMVMGTLEYAVGSIGGFCCGSKFIIEHQRLSGLGYCFSASQPPLHAVAALTAIEIMETTPIIFTQLATACKLLHKSLQKLIGMEVKGWEESPVKHLYLWSSYIGGASEDETLQNISDMCLNRGLAVTCPSYIEREEKYDPVPSLRICVNRTLQECDIDESTNTLQTALEVIELSHQTKYDYHEARQQPQEETNRPHHRRQDEAPQQEEEEDEEVTEQAMLYDQEEETEEEVTEQAMLYDQEEKTEGEEVTEQAMLYDQEEETEEEVTEQAMLYDQEEETEEEEITEQAMLYDQEEETEEEEITEQAMLYDQEEETEEEEITEQAMLYDQEEETEEEEVTEQAMLYDHQEEETEEEEVTEQAMLYDHQEEDTEEEVTEQEETSLTPEDIRYLQAFEARMIEAAESRLSVIYQRQIRRTHTQIGTGEPQNEEIADVEELDNREREAQEEHRQSVEEPFQLMEASQVVCRTPARARHPELETPQMEQANIRQLNEEDDSTHQIRRRTRRQ